MKQKSSSLSPVFVRVLFLVSLVAVESSSVFEAWLGFLFEQSCFCLFCVGVQRLKLQSSSGLLGVVRWFRGFGSVLEGEVFSRF